MLLILKAKFQPFRIYASFVNSSIIDLSGTIDYLLYFKLIHGMC